MYESGTYTIVCLTISHADTHLAPDWTKYKSRFNASLECNLEAHYDNIYCHNLHETMSSNHLDQWTQFQQYI